MRDILFTPVSIGNLTLKNRIVFPPLTSAYEENHYASKRSTNFYRTVAEGGAGLIIIGDLSASKNYSMNPLFHDDSYVTKMKELVQAVQQAGAKIGAQIFHGEYDPEVLEIVFNRGGMEAVKRQMHEDLETYCNQISTEEIQVIQDRIVAAAVRARKCGFDLIQLHGDRIAGMFSSPILNKRKDQYGGSLENRARFSLELIQRIKEAVPDLPLEYKLVMIRQNPPIGKGGPTIDEGKLFAKWFEDVGVDAFHVSIANHGFIGDTIPAMGTQPFGCFVDLAEAVKESVRVPVTAVGRIISPELAESIVSSGKADMVALGRQLIADPEWPNKVLTSREDEIRHCIMCNRGCTNNIMHREHIQCVVNYANGEETNPILEKTSSPKKTLVIGAGPAGLQSALTLSQKGHQVQLVEKENRIGGQLKLASIPPGKIEVANLIQYYQNMLKLYPIDVFLNKVCTVDFVDRVQPDIVVVASGALPIVPPITGSDWENCVSAWDVLSGQKSFGKNVLVVGAGSVGIETALFMAEVGSKVTVVEVLDKILPTEVLTLKPKLMKEIKDYSIDILLEHKLQSIDKGKVKIVNKKDEILSLEFDTIVMAVGSRPNRLLADELIKKGYPVICVGDCSGDKVKLIGDAIREGFYKTYQL